MARKIIYHPYLSVAGVLCCLAPAAPLWAQDGGYEGLIAAPAKPAAAEQPAPQPPGYEGVIPGDVSAGKNFTPKDVPPEMTTTPGLGALPPPKSSEDLKLRATLYRDTIQPPQKVSAQTAAASAIPHTRTEGMLPEEYTAKKLIGLLMSKITDKKIPEAVRAENARKAYAQLDVLAEGMRHKKGMPDEVYQQMGISDVFIREQKEGATAALVRLNAALKELQPYK